MQQYKEGNYEGIQNILVGILNFLDILLSRWAFLLVDNDLYIILIESSH